MRHRPASGAGESDSDQLLSEIGSLALPPDAIDGANKLAKALITLDKDYMQTKSQCDLFGLELKELVPLAINHDTHDPSPFRFGFRPCGNSADKLATTINRCGAGKDPQIRSMVVISQASGAGKTKLMYSIAMNEKHNKIPVVVTVVDTNNNLTSPFQQIRDLCHEIENNAIPNFDKRHFFRANDGVNGGAATGAGSSSSGSESSSGTNDSGSELGLKQYRGYIFTLVFCAHVEWAVHVLERIQSDIRESVGWKRASYLAMMSTYNGKCQEGAGKIARQRLLALPNMESPGDMVKEYAVECKRRLRKVFKLLAGTSREPKVVLAIDEAPAFMNHKLRDTDWMAYTAESLSFLTVLHDIFPSCLIGTSAKMEKVLKETPIYSAYRKTVTPFRHTCFVTANDMWDTLRYYFTGLPKRIPKSILTGLQRLEGRPLFFFDHVCLDILGVRLECKVKKEFAAWKNQSAAKVASALKASLQPGFDSAVEIAVQRIEEF